MKKILLISDTHNHLDQRLYKHINAADEVWHAGDIGSVSLLDSIKAIKPCKAVHGNIDDQAVRLSVPADLVFDCEGVRVFMTHIGGYPGRYPADIRKQLLSLRPKLFICGHSHILKVMYDKQLDLLHMNPGACGIHGFHKKLTALKFEAEGGSVKNLSVIELGDRTR